MAVVFCFSQIIEVNANILRAKSQEGIFLAMVAQEKDTLCQATNTAIVAISDKSTRENSKSIIQRNIKKVIFFAVVFFLGRYAFNMLKKWAGNAYYQGVEDWKSSLYT
ncbi:Kef-type K+ transport system membrane component KefB [Bartonella callosciuri]|uniref:Kef-type K+ transport system membrane component KefB n=1 Tax=Bartonella callosciuri TaxID=686223 RepID=A0A840NXT5_9HYPH|nr:hypothetical protein [Bartonella callosciuri]MBB5074059.1 Kef-type K+ transport system membrane component KefB [Bartonella callosciuri]